MANKTKEYSNGEITVVWKPEKCIHSKNCWTGLNSVFKPNEKPWIQLEGNSSQEIMDQIDKCPSGALSYYKNGEQMSTEQKQSVTVEVSKNGPLLVHGDIDVKDKDGNVTSQTKVTALCRCGQSQNKPYCDGSHRAAGFKDE